MILRYLYQQMLQIFLDYFNIRQLTMIVEENGRERRQDSFYIQVAFDRNLRNKNSLA